MSHTSFIRIAHRGASGLAPENTMAAFAKALEIGVDAVELDVQSSAEGEAVVIHDATLDRTTDRAGRIRDLSYAAIRQADAGNHFGPEFTGERVPLLSEALDLVCRSAVVVVEIKDRRAIPAVVSAIDRTDTAQNVVVISFHPLTLLEFRSLQLRIPAGFLSGDRQADSSRAKALECVHRANEHGAGLLDVVHGMIDQEFAYEVRRRGMALWTWTVDEVEQMRQLVALGVQGITSNYPDRFSLV